MEGFPWWNDKHRALAKEVAEYADTATPRAFEAAWKKEVPWDTLREVASKGWFGPIVPREYGGMGEDVGTTGACIIIEELSRLGLAALIYGVTLFGGVYQVTKFGNDEQKKRLLPPLAKGSKLGAVCITEPFVGSDAAGIETTAKKKNGAYVLDGKKRFITNAGIADVYVVYARTSDKLEDRSNYRHVSAFVVEKGTAGFSVEKINELAGWDGVVNGTLDFNEVRVPEGNMLGGEGYGFLIMTSGLNFERTIGAAGTLGGIREAARYALYHTQRRVQFGKRTIEFESNQYKMADMFSSLHTTRLLTYYSAYLIDQGVEPIIESTVAKLYGSEAFTRASLDCIQCMGGDGWTKFYPAERLMRDAKINEIGAGTSEVLRILLFSQASKMMAEHFRPPKRRLHEKLEIPIPHYPTSSGPRVAEATEQSILNLLAEDYKINPGLYMERSDIKSELAVSDEKLDKLLQSLEQKNLAKTFIDGKGAIRLAKATYAGLRQAKPAEYYRFFPDWVRMDQLF